MLVIIDNVIIPDKKASGRIELMRLFKIFICILVVFISSLAFSQINPKEWVVFIKSYKNEQFCVNFPDDPEFFNTVQKSDNEKLFFANAASSGANYSIEVLPTLDKDYLTKFFSYLKHQPDLEIVNYSFFNGMNKGLDIEYIDQSKSLSTKTRAIITKNSTYILSTSFKVNEKEDHTYFVSSFSILG